VPDDNDFLPAPFRSLTTCLVTVLFPAPVLTAVTATTGTFDLRQVDLGPRRTKSAPLEMTSDAFSMTSWKERSL
jgi:hypothetical protein